MNSTNRKPLKSVESPTQQSDIVIELGGRINISFLWDDLKETSLFAEASSPPLASALESPRKWTAPTGLSFHPGQTEYQSCKLCPKECGFNRAEKTHPSCGDSALRVATFGISHGDEPAIRGAQGSGAIMLSGCPLKCPSCHNPEKVSQGSPTSPEGFLRICQDLYNRGAHNIQILSPTVHLPILRSVLMALKESHFPIPIVLKTSGYESIEQLRRLDGLVDIYLPDFKFGPSSSWSRRAGVRDYFEKASLAVHEMFRQVGELNLDDSGVAKKGVLVRHVQAPLPAEERARIHEFLSQLPVGIGISIQNNFVALE